MNTKQTKQNEKASATPEKVRGNVTLSTGRTVKHKRMKNGAQHAAIVESATGEMTETEWQEYCDIIANKRTIPAEKPTDFDYWHPKTSQHTTQTSQKWAQRCGEMQGAIESLEGERDHYKVHAEALAEALRDFLKVVRTSNIDRSATHEGLTNCDAISVASKALAAWEGVK